MGTVPWPPNFEDTIRIYLPLLDKESPVTPDLPLVEFGLDSLATVSLLIDLEDLYSISIPDELLTTTSFADPAGLWKVLEQLRPTGPDA
ncbi:phosphopantetheine-binding protein [Streptomyces sp. SPB162]|uniref:phosphopantetheine-binding protein n=1 Tax=Streptomyces sp. SPB162 TaxID=2940560 RepID=UPI002406676B|nr:phosphopantetheine-binding protein [Streptomyces sp. SPB162]MDF9811452.1 acyl carrier protein [Streptomyces sp. SPB162]